MSNQETGLFSPVNAHTGWLVVLLSMQRLDRLTTLVALLCRFFTGLWLRAFVPSTTGACYGINESPSFTHKVGICTCPDTLYAYLSGPLA
jgi:hypothetical protein